MIIATAESSLSFAIFAIVTTETFSFNDCQPNAIISHGIFDNWKFYLNTQLYNCILTFLMENAVKEHSFGSLPTVNEGPISLTGQSLIFHSVSGAQPSTIGYGHTKVKAPVLVRSPKLSTFRPGQ